MIEKLPSYERAVPLGWRFMDKFIQLPFTIPPSNSAILEQFVKSFGEGGEGGAAASLDQTAGAGPSVPAPEGQGSGPAARFAATVGGWFLGLCNATLSAFGRLAHIFSKPPAEDTAEQPEPSILDAETGPSLPTVSLATAARRDVESRDVGDLIAEIRATAAGNPRELKRMANLGRLYLQLRNARREIEPLWLSPALHHYARWIALASRWPDAVRWLLWGTDEATWPQALSGTPLAVRRLRTLEDAASFASTAPDWQAAVHATLRVPVTDPSDWANDVKLFDFFKAEAARPQVERISTAANVEFW